MRIGQQSESVAKKLKMIMLEVKFKLNTNGVREEIADHGNVDTAVMREYSYAARGT